MDKKKVLLASETTKTIPKELHISFVLKLL